MRRADRLFEIIQFMRRKDVVRARDLSEALEVSERTIYRDIQDLITSGVPIEGEAGIGYVLKAGFDLPPLTRSPRFDRIWACRYLGWRRSVAAQRCARFTCG